ncbi:uncharacterized protein [Rhodnius prolixus]|uniref:Uncharacterized protein n=1 Tax=Rhodnius prolixus TaxID=13249 RepID=T1IE81_RHOPR
MKPYWPPGRNRRLKLWKRSSFWTKCKIYLLPFIEDYRLLSEQIPYPFILKLFINFVLLLVLLSPIIIIIFMVIITIAPFQILLKDYPLFQRYSIVNTIEESFMTPIKPEQETLMYLMWRYYFHKYVSMTSILDVIPLIKEMYSYFWLEDM